MTAADGRELVLKWWAGEERRAEQQSVARSVAALRGRGWPAPEVVEVGTRDGVTYTLQLRVPGAPVDGLTDELVDDVVAAVDQQAGGAVGDEPELAARLVTTLTDGGDGYCIHETLAARSARSAALLDAIRAVGARARDMTFPAADLVHYDLHHRNLLAADGRLSAIVDCDGLCRGERAFDLVCLSIDADAGAAAPAVARRLRAVAAAATDPERLAVYQAHLVLRQADWTIRHDPPARAERFLAIGEELLRGW